MVLEAAQFIRLDPDENVLWCLHNKKDARLTMLPIVYSKLSCMYVHNCTGVHSVMHNFTLHILLYTLLYTTTGCIDKPCAHFKCLYLQQLLSSTFWGCPWIEIWTKIVWDMQENMTVMKMLQWRYSNKNKSWLIQFKWNFLNHFCMKWLFSCSHMKTEILWILKLALL